jgi:hypothetical protein
MKVRPSAVRLVSQTSTSGSSSIRKKVAKQNGETVRAGQACGNAERMKGLQVVRYLWTQCEIMLRLYVCGRRRKARRAQSPTALTACLAGDANERN